MAHRGRRSRKSRVRVRTYRAKSGAKYKLTRVSAPKKRKSRRSRRR